MWEACDIWNLLRSQGESTCKIDQGVCVGGSFSKLSLSFLLLKAVIHSLVLGMGFFLLGGGRALALEQAEPGSFFPDLSSLSPSLSPSVKRSGSTKRDRRFFLHSEERLHDESGLSSPLQSVEQKPSGTKPSVPKFGGRSPSLSLESLELMELDMVWLFEQVDSDGDI